MVPAFKFEEGPVLIEDHTSSRETQVALLVAWSWAGQLICSGAEDVRMDPALLTDRSTARSTALVMSNHDMGYLHGRAQRGGLQ